MAGSGPVLRTEVVGSTREALRTCLDTNGCKAVVIGSDVFPTQATYVADDGLTPTMGSTTWVLESTCNEDRLLITTQPASFDTARAACQSEDMQLLTITTRLENIEAMAALQSQGVASAMFGLQTDSQGNFRYSSGESVTFENWASGNKGGSSNDDGMGDGMNGQDGTAKMEWETVILPPSVPSWIQQLVSGVLFPVQNNLPLSANPSLHHLPPIRCAPEMIRQSFAAIGSLFVTMMFSGIT